MKTNKSLNWLLALVAAAVLSFSATVKADPTNDDPDPNDGAGSQGVPDPTPPNYPGTPYPDQQPDGSRISDYAWQDESEQTYELQHGDSSTGLLLCLLYSISTPSGPGNGTHYQE